MVLKALEVLEVLVGYEKKLAIAEAVARESKNKEEFEDKLRDKGVHFDKVSWTADDEIMDFFDIDPEYAKEHGSFRTKSDEIVNVV